MKTILTATEPLYRLWGDRKLVKLPSTRGYPGSRVGSVSRSGGDCRSRGALAVRGRARGVLRGADTIADTQSNRTASRVARDDSAFERLFELYFDWTKRKLVSRGFTPAEGEDLAQETFVRVYRGLDDFRGDASVRTWIWTIAWRLASNHVRFAKAQKRSGVEFSLDDEDGADPAWWTSRDADPLQRLIGRETELMLEEALAQLPPQRRRALTLRLAGHRYWEIAAILKISVQSVRSHLHQGRHQMRELLADRAGEIGEETGEEP